LPADCERAAALGATGIGPDAEADRPATIPARTLVTVSQEVLLLTPVHAQPVGAVTAADAVPPAAATDWLVGLIE
jgi:hypothetical protein